MAGNNSFYVLDLSQYHNSSHERGFVDSARFGIFACMWNFVANSFVILLVTCRRHTRSQYIYVQVVNLAVADLSYSVLVDTLTVYYELDQWRLGEGVCKAWMILDVIVSFISLIIIACLNLDRLIFALRPSVYYRLYRRRVSRAVVILLPWILSSIVLCPLWLLTSVQEPFSNFCIYGITADAFLASSLVSVFIPAILLMMLTVFELLTVIGGLPDELGEFTSITFHGERLDKKTIKRKHRTTVIALCLVNFCSLAMQLPFSAISLLQPECFEVSCDDVVKMMQALSWLRSLCPGIRPLCWMIIAELRPDCGCCYCFTGSDVRERTDQMEMPSGTTAQEPLMSSTLGRNETIAAVNG